MNNTEQVRRVGLTETERFWAMENLQEIQRLPSIAPINLNYFGSEPGITCGQASMACRQRK